MNTTITETKDGRSYNCHGEEVVDCKWCGAPTTMAGTRMCDCCWELDTRIQTQPYLAEKILQAYQRAPQRFPGFDPLKKHTNADPEPGTQILWLGANGLTYVAEVVRTVGIGAYLVRDLLDGTTCEIYDERITHKRTSK